MATNSSKIAIIILAAGMSERMGKDKQLIEFRGKPILQWVIESARKSKVKEIYIVLGHHSAEIEKAVDMVGIRKVMCKDYRLGMSASLKSGISALDSDISAAVIMLGDQPLVKSSTIDKLLDAYDSYDSDMIIPVYRRRRGNPVLLSRKIFGVVQTLEGDSGARALIGKVNVKKLKVEDPGILIDIDTYQDLKFLQSNNRYHNFQDTKEVR